MQKIILITGASSGIGKALAEQLAGKGNTLLLASKEYGRPRKPKKETCVQIGVH
jgi:short-subunit dehydrogenase